MRHHPAFSIGLGGIALVTLSFAIALEVSADAARPPAGQGVMAPASGAQVDRALKGDRLPLAAPAGTEPLDVRLPAPTQPRLMDGCESALGPIDPSPLASGQRCVT